MSLYYKKKKDLSIGRLFVLSRKYKILDKGEGEEYEISEVTRLQEGDDPTYISSLLCERALRSWQWVKEQCEAGSIRIERAQDDILAMNSDAYNIIQPFLTDDPEVAIVDVDGNDFVEINVPFIIKKMPRGVRQP